MINREKVLKVVASLKTVEELANKEGCFDRKNPHVIDRRICETGFCFEGFYVIANQKRPYIKKKINNGAYVGSVHGGNLLAKDLGFYSRDSLARWLKAHPKEWGNDRGDTLLYRKEAFNYDWNGFSGIIQHFEEFAGRLK